MFANEERDVGLLRVCRTIVGGRIIDVVFIVVFVSGSRSGGLAL